MESKIIGTIIVMLVVIAIWFHVPTENEMVENTENHVQNTNIQISQNVINRAKQNTIEPKAQEKIVNNEKVLQMSSNNFEEEVLKSEKPVLLEFYADWCKPCQDLATIIDEIALEQNDIKVCKINTDEAQDLKAQYEIKAVPTIVCIKSGKEANRAVEVRSKDEILNTLEVSNHK